MSVSPPEGVRKQESWQAMVLLPGVGVGGCLHPYKLSIWTINLTASENPCL